MVQIVSKVRLADYRKGWQKFPREFQVAMVAAMRKWSRYFLNQLIIKKMTGETGNPPDGGVGRRTGELARSWDAEIKVTPRTVQSVVFSLSPYAPTQEYGATIRPVRAKWLWIPLDLTAAGVARLTPTLAIEQGGFIAKSRNGNLLFFQKLPDGGIKPLFALKNEVRVPPRLGARKLLEHEEKARMRLIKDHLSVALQRVLS
jgi:hypothetical protein